MKQIRKNFKYKNYILNFTHTFNQTFLCIETPINRYWLMLRDSPRYDIKGKYKIKIFKSINDHCYCG